MYSRIICILTILEAYYSIDSNTQEDIFRIVSHQQNENNYLIVNEYNYLILNEYNYLILNEYNYLILNEYNYLILNDKLTNVNNQVRIIQTFF